jgi:hypothetical protein
MDLSSSRYSPRTFDPRQVESEWLLGLISDAELPNLATNALCQGFDSEALLMLSICEPTETYEIRKEFEKFLSESGGGMSKKDALRWYTKHISTLILASEIPPLVGAKCIVQASLNAAQADFHEADGFLYAESEIEERPTEREFFENAIIEEAKYWNSIDLEGPKGSGSDLF